MRPLTLSFLLVVAMLLVTAAPARAGVGWCKSDPVVLIEGQAADILVSAPADAPLRVTGPTRIVVSLPRGVDASVVVSGLGFGYGEEVSFVEARHLKVTREGIQLRIGVYVPATDDMPVLLEFAPWLDGLLAPDAAPGTANSWVVLTTVL